VLSILNDNLFFEEFEIFISVDVSRFARFGAAIAKLVAVVKRSNPRKLLIGFE
jgi:hypothetical protein